MIDGSGSDLTEWDDEDFGADLDDSVEVSCPYCGQGIDLGVDQAGGEVQEYIGGLSDLLSGTQRSCDSRMGWHRVCDGRHTGRGLVLQWSCQGSASGREEIMRYKPLGAAAISE